VEITEIEMRFLWAINSLLIILLGWFIRFWMSDLKKCVHDKADSKSVEKEFDRVGSKIRSLFRHKHPIYKDREKTGEVIIE